MKQKEIKEENKTDKEEKTGETKSRENDKKSTVFDSCPHCGRELSPWEKVLLSVDRMLMCKNCWYRIILDVLDDDQSKKKGI